MLKPSILSVLAALALACGDASRSSATAASAALTQAARDHFKPIGPDKGSSENDDSLFFPNDFEAAVASQPGPDASVLFSLCRRAPFNSTTTYAPMAPPDFDAIVNDTTFVLVDGTHCYQPQNEQNIIVNPTNAQNVVTAANDYRGGFTAQVYVSHDGGKTFSDVLLPGYMPDTAASGVFKQVFAGGDPVLAFASNGTLYYANLVYDFSFPNQTPSGVAVSVSRDGGATWAAPVMVHYEAANNFFNDKEWIAAGRNGDVYITWTRFNQGPHGAGYISSNIVVAASHDFGATWSDPVQVSDASHPFDQGSSPAVAPDGTLYVAYEGNQASDVNLPSFALIRDQTVVARSTDGGKTFTNTEVGRVYDDFDCYPTNVAQGRPRLSFEQFRINSFPSLAIDPTTGALAIVWADDQGNARCGAGPAVDANGNPLPFTGLTNNQVKLVTSTNGTTWTAPHIITAGRDKVFPAAAANAGHTVVGYFTRDFATVPTPDHTCSRATLNTTDPGYPNSAPHWNDSVNVCIDYAISTSADAFVTENRVSTQSSNPYVQFSGSFIGDYTGVAVNPSGHPLAVWTDNRGNPGVTTPNQDTVVASGL